MSASRSAYGPKSPHARKLALVLLFAIGVIWGATFSLARLVTEAGVQPFGLALLHSLAGALLLLPYCLVRFRGIAFDVAHIRFYAIAGALGTAIPSAVLFTAAAQVPAGVLAIIGAMVPMMTYVLALGLRIERYGFLRSSGILFGVIAVLMIVVPETSLPTPAMAGWVLFAMLVPACYSGENVFLALRRPPNSDPVMLLCGMLFTGAAMLAPIVWTTGTWVMPWPPSKVTGWIAMLIAINTSAYLMFLELVRVAGPVFAGQVGYVVTASGVFWGILILDETYSGWIWAAIAIMFLGLTLVSPRRTAQPP